jgi:prepilin-type N-terminal cleavage/methylation domain-containing protein
MARMTRPFRTGARSGFTLLEVLVVVILIALLASLTVPRLTGTSRRVFELTVEQASDMLTMFAQRESLGSHPIGLRYDSARNELQLVTLQGDPEARDEQPVWEVDRFVRPIELPEIIDPQTLTLTVDGEFIDITDYPFAHMPGDLRPTIELSFASHDGDLHASLVLARHDLRPERLGRGDALAKRMPIDLDAAGRSREDW